MTGPTHIHRAEWQGIALTIHWTPEWFAVDHGSFSCSACDQASPRALRRSKSSCAL